MKRKLRKIIKRILFALSILFFIVITLISAYALTFSEIMYNPHDSDSGREWIELYNKECSDLSEYVLYENDINHRLEKYSNGSCEYTVVCNNCTLFLQEYNSSSELYESSFTLNNNGEYLAMKYNGTLIDSVDYMGMENIEGMSITRFEVWEHTLPTPGFFINKSSHNLSINNSINETLNNTLNITNSSSNLSINISINDSCSASLGLRLKSNKSFYENKEGIKFYNTLQGEYEGNFTIEYWIEDIFGDIVKNKIKTSNLNEKSYTPSIDQKVSVLFIKNQISDSKCIFLGNTASEEIIIVRNKGYDDPECEKTENICKDTINLKESSELSMKIEQEKIMLNVYRGDDRKYVIDVYIKNEKGKKISDLSKLNLEKYSRAVISLPLNIDACGEFEIFAEGLGFLESQKYYKECEQEDLNEKTSEKNVANKSTTQEKNVSTSGKNLGQQSAINDMNTETNISKFFNEPSIIGNIIYESKNEKTKDYSLIGIILLISGVTIYFAYRIMMPRK